LSTANATRCGTSREPRRFDEFSEDELSHLAARAIEAQLKKIPIARSADAA
jgi:hypothetical protein